MKKLTLTIAILALCGCSQKECQYDYVDPNGVSYTCYYKWNSIASGSSADSVEIETPDGAILRLRKIKQENDSITTVTSIGVMKTEK